MVIKELETIKKGITFVRQKKKFLTVISLFLLIFALVFLAIFKNISTKEVEDKMGFFPEPTPSRSLTISSPPTHSLQESKIISFTGRGAYLKDGDLYLIDNTGIKRITQSADILAYKWSSDG